MLLIIFLRFGLLFVFWLVSMYLYIKHVDSIPSGLNSYFLFPTLLVIINYAFVKMILNLIEYNNNLLIFVRNKVILTKWTLFLVDDVEIIDIKKIMKVDVECRWFFANFIWWWHLVIEQQKNDVRIIHFMPKPYKVLKLLEEKRDKVYRTSMEHDLSKIKTPNK